MTKLQQETKSLKLEVKNLNESDEYFTFEGYASTFGNVDLGDDVIVQGAFKESLKRNSTVPILWQHSMDEPIGTSLSVLEDEKGLYIKGRLPKEDSLVKERVMPQMRVGSIKEMSIGFYVKDYELKGDLRYLKEIDLFEVSLVTKAMNPMAKVSDFKSMESLKDVEHTLKKVGFSNTEAKALISKVKEFSNQRDAEEKEVQRDAEIKKMTDNLESVKSEIVNTLNKLKN